MQPSAANSKESKSGSAAVTGEFVTLNGKRYYKINNYDQMKPFFMTITSPADHWMFISSTGGLTAGRKDSDNAIFPYYTVDKVTENFENTGSKTILRVQEGDSVKTWEPFSDYLKGNYKIQRNLFKSVPGNSLIFQEVNLDLQLQFELEWTTSPKYGIIKKSTVTNLGNSSRTINVLDGIQNTLPAMVTTQVQTAMSNLLDAYKRSELIAEGELGLFYLSATLTDLAEPSESLGTTTWWQKGLENSTYLLSFAQLDSFRSTGTVSAESDVKGQRGAFLCQNTISLDSGESKDWFFCGEVNQRHSTVHKLISDLSSASTDMATIVKEDIEKGFEDLEKIIGINDGLQTTGNELTSSHQFANVMFNVMRGGYFSNGYVIDTKDLADYVKSANKPVFEKHKAWLKGLSEEALVQDLQEQAAAKKDADLERLVKEYIPVTFSRRHGDPSRPWNKFSINTTNEDGSPKIDYQGNWRDIFQNWEATLLSNPGYVFSIIAKFLNATTADGYNPYRISKAGIDWEKPEPDNPWANIGYWSDHQIIYLEKLLELAEHYFPGELDKYLNKESYVFANVPYEIAPYKSVKKDPANTIDFNWDKDDKIEEISAKIGFDGRLLMDGDSNIVHTNMIEKLLILLLAKVTNFVPDGGIWMNTQRPEWNDANNALVGNGISMVTLGYLIRYIDFISTIIEKDNGNASIHQETAEWMLSQLDALIQNKTSLETGFNSKTRMAVIDALGESGSVYRRSVYKDGFSKGKTSLAMAKVKDFLAVTKEYFHKTLLNNLREDGLFHSYNRLEINEEGAHVHYLYEMLEGQVACLSSLTLTPEEALKTLKALESSSIYREDQKSYILYPNRVLPKYLEKNTVSASMMKKYPAVEKLIALESNPVFEKNIKGEAHFNWEFRNKDSIVKAIETFNQDNPQSKISKDDENHILDLFEEIFDHKNFTGRSGTFFAYEGLGSIYWHMVSKLLLASQELTLSAVDGGNNGVFEQLRERYFRVREGIGFNKSPQVYGAFPMDPYSHTPFGAGAKQPGMTGQVKEEVITRFAEMGLRVLNGKVCFSSYLVEETEYLTEPASWTYYNTKGEKQVVELEKDSYGFTFAQVPVVVSKGSAALTIHFADGTKKKQDNLECSIEDSREIFNKSGKITKLEVSL